MIIATLINQPKPFFWEKKIMKNMTWTVIRKSPAFIKACV